jgi:hypothetical protein
MILTYVRLEFLSRLSFYVEHFIPSYTTRNSQLILVRYSYTFIIYISQSPGIVENVFIIDCTNLMYVVVGRCCKNWTRNFLETSP